MIVFNIMIGIIVGFIAIIPLFFVANKAKKIGIATFALGSALVAGVFSQHYIYPHYLLFRFEKALENQPVFALIAEHHPKQYQDYIKKIKNSFKNSKDITLVTSITAEWLNEIFNEHLKRAPNEPIDLYLKSIIELYHYLYTKMPQAVVVIETGSRAQKIDLNELSQDLTFETLLTRLLDAKKLIIQESLKKPVDNPNLEKGRSALENIYNALSKKFGTDIIQNVFIPSEVAVPDKISALVILEFYSEILATGKETAGDVMRYIANKN